MKIHSLPRVLALAVTLTLLGSACSGSPTDAATLSITTAGASATDAATVSRATIAKSEVIDELKQLIVAVESVPDTELPATEKSSLLDQLTPRSGATPREISRRLRVEYTGHFPHEYELTRK